MKNRKFLKALGARIRAVRKAKHLSQFELAHRAGINTVHLSDIERGMVNPSILVIYAIAKALDINIAQLLTEFPVEKPPLTHLEDEIHQTFFKITQLPSDKQEAAVNILETVLSELEKL